MTIRKHWPTLVLWTVFAIIFGLGFYYTHNRDKAPEGYRAVWIAARPLPANHQIVEGDLSYPKEWIAASRLLLQDHAALSQHLTTGPHNAGTPVNVDELSGQPDLTPHAPGGHVYFYVLKEDATPAGGWTEGASIVPCYRDESSGKEKAGPAKCLHVKLPILAVHRPRKAEQASWLAIEVPESIRRKFAGFALAEHRFIYQVK
jgi:hypothetical protein